MSRNYYGLDGFYKRIILHYATILKYIGFDNNGTILYKGEGNINLVAYYPYAISTTDIEIYNGTNFLVFNTGDIETPMKIYYVLNNLVN